MKRLLQSTLLLLCLWSVTGHAQESQVVVKEVQDAPPSESPVVDGVSETKLTEMRPDVIVREETITVRVPDNAPLVEYVFTDHGGTLRHVRLLNPKFTREEQPPAPDWVPKEKLEGGVIDLVMTWHAKFLPFRFRFNKLELNDSEENTRVLRVVRLSKYGRLNSEKTTINDSAADNWEVHRHVEKGDSVQILNIDSLKKEVFEVEKVLSGGRLELNKAVEGASGDLTYRVYRTGKFRDIFKGDPVYTRVSKDVTGLPITYVWPDPNHDESPLFIEKRYHATDKLYQLRLETEIHNFSDSQAQYLSQVDITSWQHPDEAGGSTFTPPSNLLAGSCFTGGALEREEFPSLMELFEDDGESFLCKFDTEWIGVDTVYFMTALAPNKSVNRLAELQAWKSGVIQARLNHPLTTLKSGDQACIPEWLKSESYQERMTCSQAYKLLDSKPGSSTSLNAFLKKALKDAGSDEKLQERINKAYDGIKAHRLSREPGSYVIYTGPKDVEILETAGHNLNAAMDYGFLAFVAEPIHQLMRWFYSVVNHWGLAIILLTLLIKLCLLPLTQKSFMAMQKMQKLKPELDKLKKEYGEDKQAFNKAMFALYKRHKVNPLGGCLPMLLQMPIWIALYQTIAGAVELYHTPLGLWIDDLSSSDPYFIMPVCMGALMVVQNAISGSTASMDGMQAKLMKWGMPIMFTAFMMFLPSGLVLYILVNTVLTIFQNLYIRRGLAT